MNEPNAMTRRQYLGATASLLAGSTGVAAAAPEFDGKRLRTIFNNDINNILVACPGGKTTPDDYLRAVDAILDMKPGVLAQNVGMPDPVIYSSTVATPWDKYHEEVSRKVWPNIDPGQAGHQSAAMRSLRSQGTDPFTLTIQACRRRGVAVVASYRMNAEDFYQGTAWFSDFDRAAPQEWRIPGRPVLDPAVPQVFEHRMAIFREAAGRYDIDGIEFDFRRWYHMVSKPLENHPALTRMVRETRAMLDETARRKGRPRMILGARVGPSLASDPSPYLFPGIYYPTKPVNASCRELGLDVRTWIGEGLVDYLCPALFLATLPGMPLTREFTALSQNTITGIYPTLWPLAAWMHGVCERPVMLFDKDRRALALYKDNLVLTSLEMYGDGADGISTFNWYSHLRNSRLPHQWTSAGPGSAGDAADAVQTYIYPLLGDRAALRHYQQQPWALPPNE